jgi:hypothetical protein
VSLEIAYVPPKPMFESTLSAFQAFTAPHIGVRISTDPLGPVNKSIRLVCNGKPVSRAVLYPVNVGSTVSIERRPTVPAGDPFEWGWISSMDYVVKVDGRTVLTVPESDLWPKPAPPKGPSWRSRARTATKRRLRAWMDAGMLRIGYSPSNETGSDY